MSLFHRNKRFDLFNDLINNFKPILEQLAGQALGQILGSLSGLIGGARVDIGGILNDFLQSIQGAVAGLGQHFLNQGLAAVLGGLGSRAFGDIFASISQQIGAAVTAAQGALSGALGGLQELAGSVIDASKPHWEQLQEQLVGHGLNVLGSLSETINNVHGSITGGR
jgi:ABC-type transporter Mla subunit MlaD